VWLQHNDVFAWDGGEGSEDSEESEDGRSANVCITLSGSNGSKLQPNPLQILHALQGHPSIFQSSEEESSFRVSGNHCAAHTAHHLEQLDISHPNKCHKFKQKPRPKTALPFCL